MAIEVSQADVKSAEGFLVAYLSEKIPDADFSPGSSVRDLCVTSIAYAFAFLRKELQNVRARQSLANLKLLPADQDRDSAVDEILSNFLLQRKSGRASTVTATLTFNSPEYRLLAAGTQFIRGDLVFTLESQAAVVLDTEDYTPVTQNAVTVYTVDLNLRCTTPGAEGNLAAGLFSKVTPALSGLISARNDNPALGGKDLESTEELLARAPLAISTRNLVNSKGISAALSERYPFVGGVTVIGAGDPEMSRDELILQNGATSLRTGGMVDVYVKLPRVMRSETHVPGALYPRPDNSVLVLRDEDTNFTDLDVEPGDVVAIISGFTEPGPSKFIVDEVYPHQLVVQHRSPFPQATDETGETLTYSVGRLGPDFGDLVTPRASGNTSRKTQVPGRIVLNPGAAYRIVSVRVGTTEYARANKPGAGLYQVISETPSYAQSQKGVVSLHMPATVTGEVVVSYESVDGLNTLQAMLDDPAERNATANLLAKAMHPIYVSATIEYTVRDGMADPGADVIRDVVVNYIETEGSRLTASRIASTLTDTFEEIWDVSPITLSYSLYAPTGQTFDYTTTRTVSVYPGNDNRAVFTGAGSLRTDYVRGTLLDLPTRFADCTSEDDALRDAANERLREYLEYLGVTDRTVRYLTQPALVTVFRAEA